MMVPSKEQQRGPRARASFPVRRGGGEGSREHHPCKGLKRKPRTLRKRVKGHNAFAHLKKRKDGVCSATSLLRDRGKRGGQAESVKASQNCGIYNRTRIQTPDRKNDKKNDEYEERRGPAARLTGGGVMISGRRDLALRKGVGQST